MIIIIITIKTIIMMKIIKFLLMLYLLLLGYYYWFVSVLLLLLLLQLLLLYYYSTAAVTHEVGLQFSTTHTRTGGLKLLVPRPLCTTFHNCVIFRAVMFWNSLPYSIINCTSFTFFRYALYNHICQVRDN